MKIEGLDVEIDFKTVLLIFLPRVMGHRELMQV